MTHQDNRPARIENMLNRRKGSEDTLIIGDYTGYLVLRNVKVYPNKGAFSGKVEIANGMKFSHRLG